MHLIVPMGGRSSRYGLTRPKWMLTHPDGEFMIEKAINCLSPLDRFDNIHLFFTESVLSDFKIKPEILTDIFARQPWLSKIRVHVMHGNSSSQLETVARGINNENILGPVMIKDCDNSFTLSDGWSRQGIMTKHVLPNDDIRRLQMKSFITTDREWVTRMTEKEIVSSDFAVGGYVFDDATTLPLAYERLAFQSKQELYMSHAVNYLLTGGSAFRNAPVTEYEDWGTIQDWSDHCATYLNLIVDIDGVLLENGSRVMYPRWGDQDPITRNVEAIRDLQATGRTKVIFATARPESYRKITEDQLSALKLDHSAGLLMGLFHSKRLLVNDFGGMTAPFPSAEAWSVLRNSEQLADIIAGQRNSFKQR